MIINNEHKLCGAFDRLSNQKHLQTMNAVYTARVHDVICAPAEARSRDLPVRRRALYHLAKDPLNQSNTI